MTAYDARIVLLVLTLACAVLCCAGSKINPIAWS